MNDQPLRGEDLAGRDVEHGFDLRERLSFVWRRWKFITAVTLLCLVACIVYLLQVTPLYTATAQVLIDHEKQKTPGDEFVNDADIGRLAMLDNQVAIIRSTAFLRRVVRSDNLVPKETTADTTDDSAPGSPSFLSSILPSSVTTFFSSIMSPVDSSKAGETQPAPTPPSIQVGADSVSPPELQAIGALQSALRVTHDVRSGDVLAISFTSADPIRAAKLANDIANAYLVDKLDTRLEAAKRVSAWLSDRLAVLRQEVTDSENAVASFRAEHGLTQSGNVTLNQQQLSDLNAKLIDAKADLAQKKASVDQLNAITAKNGNLQSMPEITNAGALPALRQQAADLSAKEAELLAHYGPTHPAVVNLSAQLRDVESSIGTETQRLAASIRNQYTLAQARVDSLEASLKQATGQTNVDDATAIHLHELERTATANKTLFEEFLKDAKVTQEQSTFEPQDIRVITPALPPNTPSSPNTKRFILISLFIGLALGVGGAVAREKLKSGFTTPKQVEDLLGLPLLSSVNHLAASELKTDNARIHAFEFPTAKPLSRYSEAIRSLRSGIRMTDVDRPPKVIQVTSAVPREGKTTIALSLAASAAAADLKVLFIDADLRHPTATRLFDLQKQVGLVDLLLGEVEIGDALTFLDPARYFVLGAGKSSQNPSDLLGSDRMKAIVAALSRDFDLVVIDTPPMGPVIDPAVMARLVDKVVLVVRWSSTARELVKQVVDQLTGHPKVAGVVFNQVNERQASRYGRHAYSYYYRSRYYGSYYTD